MPHRAPLTAQRLAEIYDESPTPVVRELLWEIHRLRATVSRANQVRQFMGPTGSHGVPSSIWECFTRDLDAEPCLTDPPTARQQAVVDKLVDRRARGYDLYD
ncbi:hypothetical protein [Paraburkholderia guartelaensis]|uniref:Uncharacterized protein n=1 Tax=Paraburkholderia guartelaensis TaxID=2546446 RepID=A0ABU9SEN6_9BURK